MKSIRYFKEKAHDIFSGQVNKIAIFHALVVIAIFLSIITGRFNHFFHTLPLNPDEAQAVANTLLLQKDMLTWRSVDGTSVGPLNFYILMWPGLFDLPITLQSAKLTSALLAAITLSLAYLIGIKFLNPVLALIPISMVTAFESLTEHADFLHYSSEYFPCLLLMLSTLFISSLIKKENYNFSLISVFILGFVPFAKLQLAPIALIMGLFVLGIFIYRNRIKLKTTRTKLLTLIFISLLPAAIILLPLLFAGEISTFWISYIQWGLMYRDEALNLAQLLNLIYSVNPLRYLFMPVLLLIAYCFTAYVLWSKSNNDQNRLFFVFTHLVFLFSLISITQPGKHFPHYLTIIIFFSVLIVFSFFAMLNTVNFGKKSHTLAIKFLGPSLIAIYSIAWITSSVTHERMYYYRKEVFPGFFVDNIFSEPNLLNWIAQPDEHLFVWGWMPQWYSFSGLTPATRETHTYNQIQQNKFSNYFKNRLLSDIKKSRPLVIIDAVALNSFWFSDPKKFGIHIFPELNKYVEEQYILLNKTVKLNNNCPALYVDSDRAKTLKASTIIPLSYTASSFAYSNQYTFDVSHVFDNSIFEQCGDAWLLKNETTGWMEATFKAQPVNQVWLLNTTGLDGKRRTRDVSLKLFLDDLVVYESVIELQPYPLWTIINTPPTKKSNKLKLEILTYSGIGAGLNEVKIVTNTSH